MHYSNNLKVLGKIWEIFSFVWLMTTEIYVQNKFALKEFYLIQFPNVIGQGEVGFEIVIDLGILVQIWPHVLAREIFIQLFFIFYNSILVSFTHGIWIGKKKKFLYFDH